MSAASGVIWGPAAIEPSPGGITPERMVRQNPTRNVIVASDAIMVHLRPERVCLTYRPVPLRLRSGQAWRQKSIGGLSVLCYK